jgi:hypothetical protein
VALAALGVSFGASSPLYHLLYNLMPGAGVFRGQERAAYLFANSMAILAGVGASSLALNSLHTEAIHRLLRYAVVAIVILTGIVFVLWLGSSDDYAELSIFARSALIAIPTFLLLSQLIIGSRRRLLYGLLAAIIVFDLFAVNMDNRNVFAPVPPTQQVSFSPPPLIARVLEDRDTPFRVDGNYRDLYGNYASLYSVLDIRGISPLFLAGPHTLIQTNQPVNPLAWEIFAVRYVFTDWNELPVSSEIVMSAPDRFGTANLHRLSNPRPFVWLVYNIAVVTTDSEAYTLLADPALNARETVILDHDVGITLSGTRPANASAVVTTFVPEAFTITVDTDENAVLTIAHPDYPGWHATIDGQPAEILRAYGATAALVIPAGQYNVQFVYDPLSYRVGAIISTMAWGALVVFTLIGFIRGRYAQP